MRTLSARTRDNVVGLAILAMLVGAAILASTYGARARLVPMTVSVGSIALLLIQLYVQNRGGSLAVDQRELLGRASEEASAKAAAEAEPVAGTGRAVISYKGGTVLQGMLIVAAYAALIGLVGVLAAVFLFTLAFFLFVSRLSIARAFGLALASEAVIYVLFVVLLRVPMNSGFIIKHLI